MTKCKKCKGDMKKSYAIQNTYRGIPDFAGHDVVTMSIGGRGYLIRCMKCTRCGWSVT